MSHFPSTVESKKIDILIRPFSPTWLYFDTQKNLRSFIFVFVRKWSCDLILLLILSCFRNLIWSFQIRNSLHQVPYFDISIPFLVTVSFVIVDDTISASNLGSCLRLLITRSTWRLTTSSSWTRSLPLLTRSPLESRENRYGARKLPNGNFYAILVPLFDWKYQLW